eukprot:TRINITY_DN1881_c0_g1_i1.p1 TRINITY_DN1881_c0_g1~~TRINITY_DN1881_c0_g1_i1.p1  ORF type:complete len:266 (+),score=49.18 TRINITY_DN1881_c0_g1_i1:455-1252(+)
MTDTNSSIYSLEQEQVATSSFTPCNNNTLRQEQQQQAVEDSEGYSSTGPTYSSCRSESAITRNMETAQSSQQSHTSETNDKKPSKIITFEDLVAGKTKFKTWSAERKELTYDEETPVPPQPSVPQQPEVTRKQPQTVSNIRKKWESGSLSENEQQQQQHENACDELDKSPKKEDDFKSIMNRFKHLEMSKADNLMFDQEEEEENKPTNVQETLVSGKASMFEKMSQTQNNNQKLKEQKSNEVERCKSDPDSVKGKAAFFEASYEK